ncbi:helix-turn-helix transcriptional regulator [Chryseobacterium populi]|uniref:ATP-dependent transcriptional regulator n=1 Tax=Chryseobacterium populi TaxID=1144316 RepID=J2JKT6_9FLAO|nr:LuxR C-terminal-related transcriptional regulator [Chryseobacterium populi]EJL68500.1 ATP-dependent transcriptional regulator [Chryseobacterium populi]
MKYYIRIIITIGVFFAGLNRASSQSVIEDSLKNLLRNPNLSPEKKAMTLSHLGRNIYETDMPSALSATNEALQLSHKLSDGQYSAFALATLTYLNVQRDSLVLAQKNIDSALVYTSKSTNKVVNGYVWLRKGWLEYIVNNTTKSTASLFKALQLLEGQGAYAYESLVYHYLASIYADLKDPKNLKKYTRLSLNLAYQSKEPDIICNAYLATASSFLQDFRKDTSQKKLLDSAMFYNRQVLQLSQSQPKRIVNHINVAASALNMANMYWEFFPKSYKGSAEKYIDLALAIARKTKHEEVIANCYGILSEYALAEGNYAEAERLFLSGFAEVENGAGNSMAVKASMMKGLATVAEKSGNQAKALNYYKQYMQYEGQAYDAAKLAIAQRLEVQYEAEKKEKELEALQERAAFDRKLNFISIGLIIAGLLALIFLFRSYHFRLKSSIQQQKLRTEEAARLQAEQELLQERQNRLQKELLAGNLQVEQKNELLHTMRDKLANQPESGMLKNQLERILKEDQRMDEDFEHVKVSLTNIHPEFFSRLQTLAGNKLTRLDLKHCSYILMGFSNKEIANRLNVDPKSILMARYRIKQKLNLEKEDSLDLLIQKLS